VLSFTLLTNWPFEDVLEEVGRVFGKEKQLFHATELATTHKYWIKSEAGTYFLYPKPNRVKGDDIEVHLDICIGEEKAQDVFIERTLEEHFEIKARVMAQLFHTDTVEGMNPEECQRRAMETLLEQVPVFKSFIQEKILEQTLKSTPVEEPDVEHLDSAVSSRRQKEKPSDRTPKHRL